MGDNHPYRSGRSSFSSTVNQNVGSLSPNPVARSSSDWMLRAGSLGAPSTTAPGNPVQAQPQAQASINYQMYPYGQYPDLNMPFQPQPPDAMAAPKIAIPRATTAKASSQRRRSARACEPCRQRKVKCDGGRPECRKCREHGMACSYIDIKRIRDQKQLGVLSEKVKRYEKLLKQLEMETDHSTARKIKRGLATLQQTQSDDGEEADDSDADSTTSHGSLDEIDLVKEDLNRSDKTVAIGFFGKNSEVAWMQKLEDVSGQRVSESDGEKSYSNKDVPIMSMSYHLDDLSIPFPETIDPFAVPDKDLADQYFNAYMESVHPSFTMIRKNTFTTQYEQFYKKKQFSPPPRKWLAVLNMIFALGCRYCKSTGKVSAGGTDTDDTVFLNRARKLCLCGNVLFQHDDLQQIQVVLLVAFYLIALGQVNGASKFSSLALRSAISLGINLKFKDDRTHYASKEARTRLWWSTFLLEHLVTSITGRISGCGEGLSAVLLPVPFDEDGAERNPSLNEIFRDPKLQASRLQLTLFQTDDEAQAASAWLSQCEPSSTLLFHCEVDLNIISQSVINSVYSIQGLREPAGQLENLLQKYSRCMDIWLRKVPMPYRFTVSPEDDTFLPPGIGHITTNYTRERITLAIYYYSARITLCRPCLSHAQVPLQKASERSSRASLRASFRTLMTLACLRAATNLLSILPDTPDTAWLTTVTPWWAILHFIMQATTALLIGLSTPSANGTESTATTTTTTISSSTTERGSIKDENTSSETTPGSPPLTKESMVAQTQKAIHWLHHLGFSSRAARRAFILCERFVSRMGPKLGIDIDALPTSEEFPPVGDVDMVGTSDCSGTDSGGCNDGCGVGNGLGDGSGLFADMLMSNALAMVDD